MAALRMSSGKNRAATEPFYDSLHRFLSPEPFMSNSPSAWQQQLSSAFRDVDALCRYLDIKPENLPALRRSGHFPLRVPQQFADCMEKRNPDDPLLRQVLPLAVEDQIHPDFSRDPVGDLSAVVEPGLIHKYRGRVLLVATGACAIHCRYCFRRHFPYSDLQLSPHKWQRALDYIVQHPDINEVILSGGDPLLLSDDKLNPLLQALQAMPQVQRLRIHSRLPVVLPARITGDLLAVLTQFSKPLVLVLHSNHPNELNAEVAHACARLQQQQVMLLNQSVLLRGVNDSVDVLCALSEKLLAFGVLPYYLHLLDKAQGTAHFDVDEALAKVMMEEMKRRLPGYLVPKLVREQAGAEYKLDV